MPEGKHTIDIELGDLESVRIGLAVSPLASLAANLFEVVGGRRPDPPDIWDATLRGRARSFEHGPLDVFRLRRPIPDVLLPVPRAGRHRFGEELERLRATPDTAITAGLEREFGDDLPAEYRPMQRDPRGELERYCRALAEYWRLALEPSWKEIGRLIDREVMVTGARLATDGAASTLGRLHPRLEVAGDTLRYPSSHSARVGLQGRPLVLVPVACSPNGILTNEAHPEAVRLGYTPPGIAEVWNGAPRDAAAELAALLGPTRARLLTVLALPSTTTALAQRLALAPSTVSHHLSGLREAGLAEAGRIGNLVYYRASERGGRLLELFEQPA